LNTNTCFRWPQAKRSGSKIDDYLCHLFFLPWNLTTSAAL